MALLQFHGERHILFQCQSISIDDQEIEQIQAEVLSSWESNPENIVLDFPNLNEEDSSKLGFLKDLSDQAQEAGCSFVLAGGNQTLQQFADDNQISYAPTQAEAVDMVFIETLERGFNNGE